MARPEWRSFPEARAFVRGLGLLDQNEWFSYCRGDLRALIGTRPDDVPANGARVYAAEGWRGMRDWLGPPALAPSEPGYVDFKRARNFARSLGLASAREWNAWRGGRLVDKPARPANVPADPERVYPRAWRGWADWLGTERRAPKTMTFLPFDEARTLARTLGLANVRGWRDFCAGRLTGLGARPAEIPANPDNVYRHAGWNGYSDWLRGAGARGVAWMPYEDARDFVSRLRFVDGNEFRAWARGGRPDLVPRPPRLPTNPHRTYRGQGWTTWGEFLGNGNVANAKKRFRPFVRARSLARRLGLRNHDEWHAFRRGERPDLPPPPQDVPADPDHVYAGRGWKNWGNFLGTDNVGPGLRQWRSFASARRFARSLRLSSVAEWRDFVAGRLAGHPRLPTDVPADPERRYADEGWRGWPDFLGRRGYVRRRIPFERARDLARDLGLHTGAQWSEWLRHDRPDLQDPPEDLPSAPHAAYRNDGWKGWGDFLGTGKIANADRVWRPFEEARAFARPLRLRSRAQWTAFGRDGRRPPDMPAKPHVMYAGTGWRGWRDFLGGAEGG